MSLYVSDQSQAAQRSYQSKLVKYVSEPGYNSRLQGLGWQSAQHRHTMHSHVCACFMQTWTREHLAAVSTCHVEQGCQRQGMASRLRPCAYAWVACACFGQVRLLFDLPMHDMMAQSCPCPVLYGFRWRLSMIS